MAFLIKKKVDFFLTLYGGFCKGLRLFVVWVLQTRPIYCLGSWHGQLASAPLFFSLGVAKERESVFAVCVN